MVVLCMKMRALHLRQIQAYLQPEARSRMNQKQKLEPRNFRNPKIETELTSSRKAHSRPLPEPLKKIGCEGQLHVVLHSQLPYASLTGTDFPSTTRRWEDRHDVARRIGQSQVIQIACSTIRIGTSCFIRIEVDCRTQNAVVRRRP